MQSKLIFTLARDGHVNVDAQKCGMEFDNISAILEYTNPNPGIMVPRPLGTDAVQRILDVIKERPKLSVGIPLVREYED